MLVFKAAHLWLKMNVYPLLEVVVINFVFSKSNAEMSTKRCVNRRCVQTLSIFGNTIALNDLYSNLQLCFQAL